MVTLLKRGSGSYYLQGMADGVDGAAMGLVGRVLGMDVGQRANRSIAFRWHSRCLEQVGDAHSGAPLGIHHINRRGEHEVRPAGGSDDIDHSDLTLLHIIIIRFS